MAAIPTFVYLHDIQGNGGHDATATRPVTEGAGSQYVQGLVGLGLNHPRFSRPYPFDPATGGVPGAPAFYPYWDGNILLPAETGLTATGPGTGNNQLQDTGIGWTADQHKGRWVRITGGTGSGQRRRITTNTTDTLTVATDWVTNPDATSVYEIKGDFVVYHHTDGADPNTLVPVVPYARGDNWYEIGGGITPATMLMAALYDNFGASAPYFKLFKNNPGLLTDGFAGATGLAAASKWADTLNEYNVIEDRVARDGDTLDVRCVILDAMYKDVVNGTASAAFQTALETTIANVKAKWSDAHIIVVNHSAAIRGTSNPGVAITLREVVADVCAATANCSAFDMSWAEMASGNPGATQSPLINWVQGENYYRTEDYVNAGTKLFQHYQAATAVAPTATPGSGIATYLLIGDSQAAGTVPWLFSFYDSVESVLGASPTYVRSGQYIYNGQAKQVQLYDITANSQTLGTTGTTNMGPDVTVLKRAAQTHTDGVVLFKYGLGGVALTSAGKTAGAVGALKKDAADQWNVLRQAWDEFMVACPRDINRTPDLRGVILLIGDNDTYDDASATEFAAEIGEFIDDIRADFKTRIDEDPAVAILEPPDHLTSGGQSTLGQAGPRASVLTSIRALAVSKTRLTVLNKSATRYELKRAEDIHYGGEAIYNIGYDAVDALIAINASDEGAAAASGDQPSGAATFIVETGSGATDSNSYCSVATADTFHQQQGNPTAWLSASTTQKQDWLRQATLAIDLRYAPNWPTKSTTGTQALSWPMKGAIDKAGSSIASNVIPTALQHATAALALQLANGEVILPKTSTGGDVASESDATGPISSSTTYLGGKPEHTAFPAITQMLRAAGLITTSGVGWGTVLL